MLIAVIVTAWAGLQLLSTQQLAQAHPLSTSAVLLTVESDRVTGQVQMPLDRLAIAVDRPLTPAYMAESTAVDDMRVYLADHVSARSANASAVDSVVWSTAVTGGRLETIDDVPHLVYDVTLTPPAGVDEFTLQYDAIVERLVSHRIFVSTREAGDSDYTVNGIIDWESQSVVVPVDGSATSEAAVFGSSVHLGVEHISEGADHLLFLIMLLLPAPLAAMGGRWVRSGSPRRSCLRVVHVVTAFAVGHSITLALAAFGYLDLSTRMVESAIALSILVSGAHAIRPLVAGGEVWIAAVFGLMHGVAFATLLADLHTTGGSLLVELLGFNLGIELTQLLVVALVMPSLLLLSTTRAYTPFRVGTAGIGMVLAAAWLLERLGLLDSSPFDAVTDVVIAHPFGLCALLFVAAVFVWLMERRADSPSVSEPRLVDR